MRRLAIGAAATAVGSAVVSQHVSAASVPSYPTAATSVTHLSTIQGRVNASQPAANCSTASGVPVISATVQVVSIPGLNVRGAGPVSLTGGPPLTATLNFVRNTRPFETGDRFQLVVRTEATCTAGGVAMTRVCVKTETWEYRQTNPNRWVRVGDGYNCS